MIMLRNFPPTAMFRTPFARIFLTFQKQIEALENDREVPSEQKTAVRMLNNEHNNANRYHTACSPEHLRVVLFFFSPFSCPSPSCAGHSQCYRSTTPLIMHWLREPCEPEHKSYFCVQSKYTDLSFIYSKSGDDAAVISLPRLVGLTPPPPLCRVGGGGVDALEMINNLKYEAKMQK